jgi:hypothetical protein
VTRTILRERIPASDPRLGRHVYHDSESRRYTYDTSGLKIVSAKHRRRIPVLDQGSLGSCTGNAGIGCLGTDPFFGSALADHERFQEQLRRELPALESKYSLDEAGAVWLYSDATKVDDYPGTYPPTDTGSDGLTVAKVLQRAGEIAGYQHTFSLDAALRALGQTPVITGTIWTEAMFYPDLDGRIHPTLGRSSVAGGHEYVLDEIDAERERVWLTNSWGTGFGIQGHAYLTFADFGSLLAEQGDVTVFVPLTQPPPTPTPTPADPADSALATALRHNGWIDHRHVGDNHVVQLAAQQWLAAKHL